MNTSFIELSILKGDTVRRLVRPAGADIFLAANSADELVIDDLQVPPQARFTWGSETELSLEPLEVGSLIQLEGRPISRRTAVGPGERITLESATVTWRWLSPEENPTLASDGKVNAALFPKAAATLAAELSEARYQRGPEVGHGGMGKVLQALEKPLRRSVALKVLREPGEDEDQERFIREARITGQLEHPSIVPVHELGIDQTGHPFYTMKLVKGVTLLQVLQDIASQKLETLRRYPLASLLTVFQKVCDAIAFAHGQRQPIIHRDLKPENIMVGDYGEVMVMDWGAAKVMTGNGRVEERDLTAAEQPRIHGGKESSLFATRAGSVMGTPGYMAPEQARGEAATADERTDIYALGAILYALLTLEAPTRITNEQAHNFEHVLQTASDTAETFRRSIAPLLADRDLRPRLPHLPARTVPASLAAVVFKAMALRPSDRFASVKDLQADVAAYQSGFATSAEEARTWRRFKLLVQRNKVLFGSLAAVFVILLVATAISLQQRQAALASNTALQATLRQASAADLQVAQQRFRTGAWREGLALLGRSLTFWPENKQTADYLLSAIAFGHGDGDQLPLFGVYHGDELEDAAFSRDGRYFVTASDDHTAQIWDSSSGVPVGQALQHSAPVWCAQFSPDGKKLATGDEMGLARIWDVQTGNPLTKPMPHGKPDLDPVATVETITFSRDGHRILTGCWDHSARLWEADTGNLIAELLNPKRTAAAVFSPDETRILTSYWGGAILWDAKTFSAIGTPMAHDSTVRRSYFTPDGNKIVTSSLDKTARVWDGHTAKPLSGPLQHEAKVSDLDISPDGKLMVTASADKAARMWMLDNAKATGVPMRHDGPIETAVFHPDGQRILTASRDKTVRLWSVASSQQIGGPMRHDEMVVKAIFSPDGTKILSIGGDRAAYIWETPPAARWPGEVIPIPGEIAFLDFIGSNEDHLFVATRDGSAGIWSLSRHTFASPVINLNHSTTIVAFHSATKRFAAAGLDGTITLWDAASGQSLGQSGPAENPLIALEFAHDGSSLFASSEGRILLEWKIGREMQRGSLLKLSTNSQGLAAAPGGGEIAMTCGGANDLVQFWNPSTGKLSRKPITHNGTAIALAYHPEGHLIATACADQTARLWSLDSGEQQGDPFYLNGPATAVHFTGEGTGLLVGGLRDTQVSCYDVKTHDSLCYSLPHSTGVSHITSNESGSLIATVTNDGVARLWRIPKTSEPPPAWLPDYLRALGGLAFTEKQQLAQVPMRERLALRKKLLERPRKNSTWDEIMVSTLQPTESGTTKP